MVLAFFTEFLSIVILATSCKNEILSVRIVHLSNVSVFVRSYIFPNHFKDFGNISSLYRYLENWLIWTGRANMIGNFDLNLETNRCDNGAVQSIITIFVCVLAYYDVMRSEILSSPLCLISHLFSPGSNAWSHRQRLDSKSSTLHGSGRNNRLHHHRNRDPEKGSGLPYHIIYKPFNGVMKISRILCHY